MRARLAVAAALVLLPIVTFGLVPAAGSPVGAPTSITTTLHGFEQSASFIVVPPNTAVHDSAVLTGTNVATAGGTVTYGAYSDNECKNLVASAGTKTVTNGVVPDSDALILPVLSTFFWRAEYSGDANNAPTSSCDEVEVVLVATPGVFALADTHLWLGLRNSDDQGTKVDVLVQLYKNDDFVAQGLQRCVANLTRNPALAREVVVPWDSFSGAVEHPGDVFTVKVRVRIGTDDSSGKCTGHGSATGVRLYYDSPDRDARFNAQVFDFVTDWHFRADGGACGKAPGPTFLVLFPPLAGPGPTKCRDSGAVALARGNRWAEIGTWEFPTSP